MNPQWPGLEPNNLFLFTTQLACPIFGYSPETKPRFTSGSLRGLSLFFLPASTQARRVADIRTLIPFFPQSPYSGLLPLMLSDALAQLEHQLQESVHIRYAENRVTFHDTSISKTPMPLSLLRHAVFGKRSEMNQSAPSQVSSKSFRDLVRYIFWTTDQQTCPLDLDDPRSTPSPGLEHLI